MVLPSSSFSLTYGEVAVMTHVLVQEVKDCAELCRQKSLSRSNKKPSRELREATVCYRRTKVKGRSLENCQERRTKPAAVSFHFFNVIEQVSILTCS